MWISPCRIRLGYGPNGPDKYILIQSRQKNNPLSLLKKRAAFDGTSVRFEGRFAALITILTKAESLFFFLRLAFYKVSVHTKAPHKGNRFHEGHICVSFDRDLY